MSEEEIKEIEGPVISVEPESDMVEKEPNMMRVRATDIYLNLNDGIFGYGQETNIDALSNLMNGDVYGFTFNKLYDIEEVDDDNIKKVGSTTIYSRSKTSEDPSKCGLMLHDTKNDNLYIIVNFTNLVSLKKNLSSDWTDLAIQIIADMLKHALVLSPDNILFLDESITDLSSNATFTSKSCINGMPVSPNVMISDLTLESVPVNEE